MPLCDPRILDLVLNIFMLHKIVDGCTAHIYIRTHSHWHWHCHTHTHTVSQTFHLTHFCCLILWGNEKYKQNYFGMHCIAIFWRLVWVSCATLSISLYIFHHVWSILQCRSSPVLYPSCVFLSFSFVIHSRSSSYGFSVSVFNLVFILSYLFIYHTF